MERDSQDIFGMLAGELLSRNDDYPWLRTMLEQAAAARVCRI